MRAEDDNAAHLNCAIIILTYDSCDTYCVLLQMQQILYNKFKQITLIQ